MNILVVGDFSKNYDEGLKNVAKHFEANLSKYNNVKKLNIKRLYNEFFSLNKDFIPQVIHYFTTPTIFSFIILFVLRLKYSKGKIVLSSLHSKPSFVLRYKFLKKFLKRLLKIDIVLYQANKDILKGIGEDLRFFPNGVDTYKFKPCEEEIKLVLRKKYGIKHDKFIILHVGHIFEKRNLEIFKIIQDMDENYQVLIIGGNYLSVDERIARELEASGCKLLIKYFSNLEEIYAIADCYVFPVEWGNTISMPLTILEAMATDLPVISLDYPFFNIFNHGTILSYSNQRELELNLSQVKKLNKNKIGNRQTILPYSWNNLTEKIEKIYREFE